MAECASGAAAPSDGSMVQIKASSAEVYRRIEAFAQRKRAAINEHNRRLYCGRIDDDVGDDTDDVDDDGACGSCARVDAVHVALAPGGCKSRLKVSRVTNKDGPQTASSSSGAAAAPRQLTSSGCSRSELNYGIDERLSNMEAHLGLQRPPQQQQHPAAGVVRRTDGHTTASGIGLTSGVLARIRQLEDRILFLESISPEYAPCVSAAAAAVATSGSSLWRANETQRLPVARADSRSLGHRQQQQPSCSPVKRTAEMMEDDDDDQALSLGAIEHRMRLLRNKLKARQQQTTSTRAPDSTLDQD